MREFIVFGDYKNHSCPRADFKILDFIVAESPSDAFKGWLALLRQEDPDALGLLEEDIYIMQVDTTRRVFDLATGKLSQQYTRDAPL